MHKLLARQLRHIDPGTPIPADLLTLVDDAYHQADMERTLLERSMDLLSDELVQRNRELRRELDERHQLEVELRQAQKLEAVGQLAAGSRTRSTRRSSSSATAPTSCATRSATCGD